jgi:hypothetical protein
MISIEGRKQTARSFFRITVGTDTVRADFYRDDTHGGSYSLRKSLALD